MRVSFYHNIILNLFYNLKGYEIWGGILEVSKSLDLQNLSHSQHFWVRVVLIMKRGMEIFIYHKVPFCEIQADTFMSLECIRRVFRQVKYRKTSKNISQYFKRRHPLIILCIIKLKKILIEKIKISQKVKNIHESLELEHFW